MQKLKLELPKVRLELHFRFVKRRKPLVSEPIIPSVAAVKRKYRTGSLPARFLRYLSDHKSARKIFASNLAAIAIATSFFPTAMASESLQAEETIITTQNPISTQKAAQLPLQNFKVNQGFSFFHPGVDFGANLGAPISAVKAGEVVEAGYTRDGYGNTIVINHGKGLTSRYAHLSKIEVVVGEEVTTNTEIGTVGITGHSSGPHLHLEVRQNGFALNPLTVLPH